MTVLYVDLSHHDVSRRGGKLPDWKAIREATSPVMCARATYGDPQGFNPSSRYFREMVRGARAAGFTLLGAYHNLVRGDQASINRQVDYLRREMDAAGANWAMLDVERYEELVSRGLQPRFSDAVAFCERWRAVDKRALTVYLPKWIWDGHMGRPDLRKLRAPLVASNYGSNPDGHPTTVYRARGGDAGVGWNAYGGVTPTIWQFGSDVDCPGASSATDLNAFRGSLADLTRILNPAAAAPAAPTPEVPEMEQSDKLAYGTDKSNRTVGHVLADLANLRNWVVSPMGAQAKYLNPAPNSPLALLLNSLNEARLRDEAILRAVAGTNAPQILTAIAQQGEQIRAAIDARAAEDAERDQAMLNLLDKVRTGEATAEQVLVKLRELLPAGEAAAES